MSSTLARLRGPLVAVVVLALSAGAALAGGDGPPTAAEAGLSVAEEASGLSLPARPEVDDEEEVEAETTEPEELADPESEVEGSEEDGTHGALVSEAAQMETPDGFVNAGAFVSCVARMNRGQLGPEFDLSGLELAALTPDDCAGDNEADEADAAGEAEASAAGPGKSAAAIGRGAAKAGRGNPFNR